MVSSLFNLIFSVFESTYLMYCAACVLVVGVFGLIRRFVIGNYRLGK